jgi:hypothetical protein
MPAGGGLLEKPLRIERMCACFLQGHTRVRRLLQQAQTQLILTASALLCGCNVAAIIDDKNQRNELLSTAKVNLVGMNRDRLLDCAGAPFKLESRQSGETWIYGAQKLEDGYGRYNCTLSIGIEGGVVTSYAFNGPSFIHNACALALEDCFGKPGLAESTIANFPPGFGYTFYGGKVANLSPPLSTMLPNETSAGQASQATQCLLQQNACNSRCNGNQNCAGRCYQEALACSQNTTNEAQTTLPSARPPVISGQSSHTYEKKSANSQTGFQSTTMADGVAAVECLRATKKRSGFNVADNGIKNFCGFKIHVVGACIERGMKVLNNYPYPGVYDIAGSGLTSLGPEQSEDDPSADVCQRKGGQMKYIVCREGTPHFTSPDGSQFNCYR